MKLLNNKISPQIRNGISRRQFLGTGLITVAAAFVPSEILAAFNEIPSEKELSFYNMYTHERLDTVFWKDGQYVQEALFKINYIFRDSRTGKVRAISTELLDLLFSVREKLKSKEPFHIVSGYRSPGSNALLRKRKKGVAKNSLHMYGKALDLRLPGQSLKRVKKAAISCKAGGVGFYPRSKFVHVDVGPVRSWWG